MLEDRQTRRYFCDINSLAQWLVPDGDETVSLVLDPRQDGAKRHTQYDRAAKLVDGDVLLSFVKGVCCWTGASVIRTNTAKSHTKPLNPVESADPWSQHFGYALDIQPWFNLYEPDLCFFSTNKRLGVHYQGRGIYQQMHRLDDCNLIIKEVERLHAMTGKSVREAADEGLKRDIDEFGATWKEVLQRDPYLTEIAVSRSGGRCDICGTTAAKWVDCLQRKQPDQSYNNVFGESSPYGYAFLEGHHELPCARGGDARLENLFALCPNCHRVVHGNINALHKDEKHSKRA